jgi:hypothetical protein
MNEPPEVQARTEIRDGMKVTRLSYGVHAKGLAYAGGGRQPWLLLPIVPPPRD